MRRRLPACLLLASLPSLGAEAACAQSPPAPELSAQIVSRDASGRLRPAATLYLAHGMLRIETADAAEGYFLVDTTAGTAVFVEPARRIFMDARQSTSLTQIFIPVDPAAPCRDWQAASTLAGVPGASEPWHCERLEDQPGASSGTYRYHVQAPGQAPGQAPSERWVSPQLRLTVRVSFADGSSLTLEHLRSEPQPASLFSIPPGFARLDPEELIRRLRHSDVWVTPPH